MSAVPLTQDLTDLIRFQRREVAGISQTGAAVAAGYESDEWWRKVESGSAKSVQADTLARMCYAIDITPEQLRNIGQDEVADLVQRRRELLEPAAGEAEVSELSDYLMGTPFLSESNREVLVSVALGLLKVQHGTEAATIPS